MSDSSQGKRRYALYTRRVLTFEHATFSAGPAERFPGSFDSEAEALIAWVAHTEEAEGTVTDVSLFYPGFKYAYRTPQETYTLLILSV